ncbi:MAG: triose-phosphate isomerase [Sphingomonadaceae bacterium]|uniref:triose-phosphate isomerase n=1 Tax=Thermaurantiacus sp. TaxID=2820283 RepID=UPI00298EDEA9|nr:triose-phosphate isomerase [Thermaurantiacus sp.]MCS6986518.1 triose-phosphate isomerase [Sphingomonadaceae bacterium]MDW8414221.1 triose-phosphate isomerase [Thermaurantiacus sp.]
MQLIAGNWKMNGLKRHLAELEALLAAPAPPARLVVCPPATLLAAFAERAAGSAVAIGAQDCHPEPAGAFTGDLSAEMLADAGARYVIVGHSERRMGHHETDALVQAKARAAQRAGLAPIVCVGESLAEREAGRTLAVVLAQLAASLPADGPRIVAYEPVWAIGSGRTPSPAEIEEVHAAIVARVGPHVPVLYGGSVNPRNAGPILALPSVGGALVGGASLEARSFLAVAAAARP